MTTEFGADVSDPVELRRCEVCGNVYDHAFVVEMSGDRHVFDSFECAIHRLAPTCAHCGCRIIGHGAQVDDALYCCAHCAREQRPDSVVRDRVDDRSMG